MAKRVQKKTVVEGGKTEAYDHKAEESLLRPDIGLQAQFKKQKPPKTYRYDSSLDPAMSWDEGNPARERAEALIKKIQEAKTVEEAKAAADMLARMSKPFLNWSGKAERIEFNVPTLPLFTHERLSTQAILATLKSKKRDKQEAFDFYGDADIDIADRALQAYEHKASWVNRMILGDSLVVMNSLLQYQSLGGQVQMIFMDPPYGVKFGSNFQPFVRKRDVKHGDDESMTREPEVVQAYRDTWEMGLHSYLTYLRDRFRVAHDLLHPTGSIFVQISDENVHYVRQVLGEVFGEDNFVCIIPFRKKTMPLGAQYLDSMYDFLVWYAKDYSCLKFKQLFQPQNIEGDVHWKWYEDSTGKIFNMAIEEINNHKLLPQDSNLFRVVSMKAPGYSKENYFPVQLNGRTFYPPKGGSWTTGVDGMERLKSANRLFIEGNTLTYKLYYKDFVLSKLTNIWGDTVGSL